MSAAGALDVIVVEPWYGGSHRAWADGLVASSRHRLTLVTLDASFWRWRMRGGAVTIASALREHVERFGRPDAVVVSDMVDLSSLLGLARDALDGVPVGLYLHENQLVHPPSTTGDGDELYAQINWQSMVAADRVYANSSFHRDALLAALPAFLRGAPDHPHVDELAAVAARCSVLPVGVDVEALIDGRRADGDRRPPLLVWNQRWDHDKAPEALFRVLRALARDGVGFRLAIAGENQRNDPQEFDAVVADLADRIEHVGWLPRAAYLDLLLRADVVVSTARHEFFGIAAVEAMAAGAVPLLPDRLSYPELVPEWARGACLYRSKLYERLREVLCDIGAARARVAGLRDEMRRLSWREVAPSYDEAFEELASLARAR